MHEKYKLDASSKALVQVFDEVQKMCDEAFERGLKTGRGEVDATDEPEEKFEVRCEIEFDVQCDKDLPKEIATKTCYLSALKAAVELGREQGLDYCDIECDLSDEYYRQVDAEEE